MGIIHGLQKLLAQLKAQLPQLCDLGAKVGPNKKGLLNFCHWVALFAFLSHAHSKWDWGTGRIARPSSESLVAIFWCHVWLIAYKLWRVLGDRGIGRPSRHVRQ